MQIVIFGTGNVATVLGKKIMATGHQVVQVFSRTSAPSAGVAVQSNSEIISHFSQLYLHADIYLLAVSDDAIQALAHALPKVSGIVVHTAGAVNMGVLQSTGERYGVVYPLQSLRKEKDDYENIPLLIDGSTPETLTLIQAFAQSISPLVAVANDDYRLKLHTAAVVVSNFTNHLYALAADFCRHEKADFSLLQPLIEETAKRLQYFAPAHMQTGPAIRNDVSTIQKHLALLRAYPQLQQIYKIFTESIQQITVNSEK